MTQGQALLRNPIFIKGASGMMPVVWFYFSNDLNEFHMLLICKKLDILFCTGKWWKQKACDLGNNPNQYNIQVFLGFTFRQKIMALAANLAVQGVSSHWIKMVYLISGTGIVPRTS